MKIGEIAKHFGISTSAIRFYVDNNLVTPLTRNNQYVFTEKNIDELKTILKLKDISFSIKEIQDFLRVAQLYNLDDMKKNEHILKMLRGKKAYLESEKTSIDEMLVSINKEIDTLTSHTNSIDVADGFSTLFLNYLHCPKCESRLDMKNLEIRNGNVVGGEFFCSCGYFAYIENGIICVPYESVMDRYYKSFGESDEEFIFIDDFTYFHNITEISEETSSMLTKAYNWLDNWLLSKATPSELIFAPGLSSHFLYKHINRPYFQNSHIVISFALKNQIEAIKEHIGFSNSTVSILYFCGSPYSLPLKKGSIDLWIDAVESYNHSFFSDMTLPELIDPYLHKGSEIIGLTKYLAPNAKESFKLISELYPFAHEDNSKKESFIRLFDKLGWTLNEWYELGAVSDPGKYYNYIHDNDEHYFACYSAKK